MRVPGIAVEGASIALPFDRRASRRIHHDGVVTAGPLRCLPLQDGFGFRCPDNAFEHPIRRVGAIVGSARPPGDPEPREVPVVRLAELLSVRLRLTSTFTSMADAIRSVVKYASPRRGRAPTPSPRRSRISSADKLGADGLPEWVEARRDRILRLMRLSVEIPKQLNAQMELLLVHGSRGTAQAGGEAGLRSREKQSLELQEGSLRFSVSPR